MLMSEDISQPCLWVPASPDIIKSPNCKSITYDMTTSVYSWSKDFNFELFEKQQTYFYNLEEQLDNLESSTNKLCQAATKITAAVTDEVIEETESDDDTFSADYESLKSKPHPDPTPMTLTDSLQTVSVPITTEVTQPTTDAIVSNPVITPLVLDLICTEVPSTLDSVGQSTSLTPDQPLTPKRKTPPQLRRIIGVRALNEATITTAAPKCRDHVGDGRLTNREDGGCKRQKKDPADGYRLFFNHLNETIYGKQREQEVAQFIKDNKHIKTYKNNGTALSSLNSQKWKLLTEEEQNVWRKKAELINKAVSTFILPK